MSEHYKTEADRDHERDQDPVLQRFIKITKEYRDELLKKGK